jgi:hypothetical protein
MDCDTARLLLAFARPRAGDLAADEADKLKAHCAGCPDCSAAAQALRSFDEPLGQAMRRVEAPPGLRQRLHGRLNADRAAARRRWLRLAAAYGGLAAAVLLWLGGILYWRSWQLPPLNGLQVYEKVVQVDDYSNLKPEELDELFRQLGVETVAPRDLKYEYLTFAGLKLFEGRPTPYLSFQRRHQQAQLYILSDRQFNLEGVRNYTPPEDSGYKKVVIFWTADKHYAYVIAFTGDDSAWLFPTAETT